eukprot:5326210-Amphidinium_carterae.1
MPVYVTGNQDVTQQDMQKLRGTAQRWTAVLPGLRLVLRGLGVDVFLTADNFVQPNASWRADKAWEQLWAAI